MNIQNQKNVTMTRILVSGFSILLILLSCTSGKKMSKSINKNVFPDAEGKIYYRDYKNAVEIKYFGDYTFSSFSKKQAKELSKKWGVDFSTKDSILFLASTNISPYYKSAVIRLSSISSNIFKSSSKGMNVKDSDFLFIDTATLSQNKFAFLFWGNYLTSYPDTTNISLAEKKALAQIEIDEIRKTITQPQKLFFNDISTTAYNSLSSSNKKNELNYLAPIVRLSAFLNKNLNHDEENYLYQLLSTYQSFFGNTDSAFFYYNKAFNKKFVELNLADTNVVSAKEKILTLAKTNQIILINEAHSDVRNRNFLRLLLPDLYALDYKILAAEAVSQNDSLLNTRKYSVSETGFYTKEPVFASLINTALATGFTVLGYDYFPDCANCGTSDSYCCVNRREEGQANNISKIIAENPSKKIIVLGGHDHIYKAVPQKGFKTMAMFLAEKGVPFASIDQVKGNYYFLPDIANDYLSVNDTALLPKSFTNYNADAYIIPPYPFAKKLTSSANNGIAINLNRAFPESKKKKRYYLKVFHITDTLQAGSIPVFVSEVKPSAKKIKLPLAKGRYVIQVLSVSKLISEQKVNVE